MNTGNLTERDKEMTLLEELKARGLVEAVTDSEIEKLLETPQTVYCGFDPSAASLQAGNLVSIMVLRRLSLRNCWKENWKFTEPAPSATASAWRAAILAANWDNGRLARCGRARAPRAPHGEPPSWRREGRAPARPPW